MTWDSFVNDHYSDSHDVQHLLRTLNQQMFIVAYGKMRNAHDAQDVVQDAWVKILDNINTLLHRDKLLAWAKTIVSNTAINALKQKHRLTVVPTSDELLEQHYNKASADQMESQIVDQLFLFDVLQLLDERTAHIIFYKYYCGYDDQWIARQMNMPLGTVKARVHRTLKQIQQWQVLQHSR